jgi:hypothetical protein
MGREILYEDDSIVLKALRENHREDYSLRYGPLYVEFSSVQWTEHVLLLHGQGDDYMSVRHSTDENYIPYELYDTLMHL